LGGWLDALRRLKDEGVDAIEVNEEDRGVGFGGLGRVIGTVALAVLSRRRFRASPVCRALLGTGADQPSNEDLPMKTAPLLTLLSVLAGISSIATAAEKINVVYHLSEPDRTAFVLNNMQNHIDGVGGPENINMVLVVHGPAINAFSEIEATEKISSGVASLREQGVDFEMCGNTLKGFNLGLDELLPGFVEVSQGGVTRIGELQTQGYVYIRP
jgi:intracellular sulfur oxidation DsrE/DsrF family protein